MSNPSIQEQIQLDEIVHQAETAFQTGDFPTAERLLINALDHCPQRVDLMFLLGHTYMERQDFESGLACYNDIAALAPNLSPVQSARALAMQLLSRTEEAKAAAERALELASDDPVALKVLARIHLNAGEGVTARQYCARLLALDAQDDQIRPLLSEAEALCRKNLSPKVTLTDARLESLQVSPLDVSLPSAKAPVGSEENLIKTAQYVGGAWVQAPYYDEAEPCMDRQWTDMLYPFLQDCDFSVVMDLAAGHGRNCEKLRTLARKIVVVDINEENINFCRQRFAGDDRFIFYRNNGVSLERIPDNSLTLIYCFDAMVHFDSDVIRNYLKEFRRVLRPGGRGFCHHSNTVKYPGADVHTNPGWRNFMSQPMFAHYCAKEGLNVLRWRILDWGGRPESDCLSLFEKPMPANPALPRS